MWLLICKMKSIQSAMIAMQKYIYIYIYIYTDKTTLRVIGRSGGGDLLIHSDSSDSPGSSFTCVEVV